MKIPLGVQRKIQRLERNIKTKTNLAQKLEQSVDKKREPFLAKINSLQDEMNKAVNKMDERRSKAENAVHEMQCKVEQLRKNALIKLVATHIPTDAEFLEIAGFVETFLKDKEPYALHSMDIFRPPVVDGYTIKAARDGDYGGCHKVYYAWSNRSKKLVAVMKVTTPRHAMDSTDADALVRGKRLFKNLYNVNAPLRTFLDTLQSTR